MDPKLILRISKMVYQRFPEMDGKKPRVRRQKPNGKQVSQGKSPLLYLLTYKGQGQGPGGRTIPRMVRVVASERGKILKISTSRGG